MPEYRDLITGDIIQLGDEWFNADWEVGGPWFEVVESTKSLGMVYDATTWRPMRRPL